MPVAFLIHGRKKEKVQARFFDFVSSVFPKLNRKFVPFVTDRETGLVNAIDKNFPNCDVIMCWNHLINDFKFNLQKMGADHTNIAVYVTNIKELLRCNSEEEYKEKNTVLTSKWSKPIVSYFQKMDKDILKHCGKWVIDKYKYNTQENHNGLHRYRIKRTVQFMF
jgi:transposase-like protein